MKLPCVVLAAIFLASAGVNGKRCKAVHAQTGSLKCGDKVYSVPPERIAAYNQCTTEGADLKIGDSLCVMEKLGIVISGEPDLPKMKEAYGAAFGEHGPALLSGTLQCFGARTAANAIPDEYEPVECLAKVFEDVCGHKSCDWINNLEDSQRDEF